MSIDRHLTRHGHLHRFVVTNNDTGWDVCEQEDAGVLRRTHRGDWHRVERDVQLFELTAMALKRDGWVEN
jgi:hypothetical protein